MKRIVWICAVSAFVLLRVPPASGHGAEMLVGSTASGSGALGLAYEFSDKVVVTESVSLGGMTLYSSIFPGFEWLQDDDSADSLYRLAVGTPFSVKITAIDPDAALKIGGTTLNAKDQTAFVATTTNVAGDHVHPEWELILPAGEIAERTVSFEVTTTSHSYTTSQEYTLVLTNASDSTETPTATITPTPTSTATPVLIPTSSATASPQLLTPTPTAAIATATAPPPPQSATPSQPPEPTETATPPPPTPVPTDTRTLAVASETPTATSTPSLPGDANGDTVLSAADIPAMIEQLAVGEADQQDLLALIEALFE